MAREQTIVSLNFDEQEVLGSNSGLRDLYTRFRDGMLSANELSVAHVPNSVTLPDFATHPPVTSGGEIDEAEINRLVAVASVIRIKNSAHMMANSIMSSMEGGDHSDDDQPGGYAGYVSRGGDTMMGNLSALQGFQAGQGGIRVFDAIVSTESGRDIGTAHVYGMLIVDSNATIGGQLRLGNSGLYFGNAQTMYYNPTAHNSEGALCIGSQNIDISGVVNFSESIRIGSIFINQQDAYNGQYVYYHGGNANNILTDWSMDNGLVDGNLTVNGTASFAFLSAKDGFELGGNGEAWFYTYPTNTAPTGIRLGVDLAIMNNCGIKFGDNYIIRTRNNNTVSFSAPGMTMNLGDDNTNKITLQSSIYDASGVNCLITSFGGGYFPNSLRAAHGGSNLLETYSALNDSGVIFQKIRFGAINGPSISTNDRVNTQLLMRLPYTYVSDRVTNTVEIPLSLSVQQTDSLLQNQSLDWSATLHFNTDSEFFAFDKPVEGSRFSIKSQRYKTHLTENTLFFSDGVFIEGVPNGIHYKGDSVFDEYKSLGVASFASGFAGHGWAILYNIATQGYSATFDELTIRKKMRVYELEVQKISATNGSLWVSDACSGDYVEELV